MTRFVLHRLGHAIPLLFGVSVIGFALMHLAPGGPLSVYTLNPTITAQDLDRLKIALGLDRSALQQYVSWASSLLVGDWGHTFFGGRPVLAVIIERVPATLILSGTALALSLLIGVTLGMLGAVKRYSVFDYVTTTGAMVALSFPTFWFGLMAIFVFAVRLGWFPSGGMHDFGEEDSISDLARHLVLPALVLALVMTANWSRYARSSFLEVLGQDFMRTARAKGVRRGGLVWRHAFPNAVKPLIALLGVELPFLFSGALVAETIFAWPGVGRLFVDALNMKEYPILMGMLMFTAIVVILGNLLADVAVALLDPRVRVAG